MALEILGVFVNQVEQVTHQLTERLSRAETRDDREQPGVAPGENLQRSGPPASWTVCPRPSSKEPRTLRYLVGADVITLKRSYKACSGLSISSNRLVALPKQDDSRLGLQRLAQPPSGVGPSPMSEKSMFRFSTSNKSRF